MYAYSHVVKIFLTLSDYRERTDRVQSLITVMIYTATFQNAQFRIKIQAAQWNITTKSTYFGPLGGHMRKFFGYHSMN